MTQDTGLVGFKPKLDIPDDDRNPLQEFEGVLKRYVAVPVEGSTPQRMRVSFEFTDLSVIKSTVPYPFPVATVQIPYSERPATAWKVFGDSAKKALPTGDIDLLVGKRNHWVYGDCKLRRPNDAVPPVWGDVDAHAWQVVSVEGYSSTNDAGLNLTDLIVDLCDGKKDADIYTAIYQDMSLKSMAGYEETIEAVGDRTLLPALKVANRISQDGTSGIWKKVS